MRTGLTALAVAVTFSFSALWAASELQPEVPGPTGRQVFEQLATFYEDSSQVPPYHQALVDLAASDADVQKRAGEYLYALLVQTAADEKNGRPAWKGVASEFRHWVAEAFAEQAQGEASLAAALWLIDEDELFDDRAAGAAAFSRVVQYAPEELLKRLLQPPHPNSTVTVAAVTEVGRRRLSSLSDQVLSLCRNYDSAVRRAARGTAAALGLKDLPGYRPEEAFTPWLAEQLTTISSMVMTEVPREAEFKRLVVTRTSAGHGDEVRTYQFSGWLLEEGETYYRVLNFFGQEWRCEKRTTEVRAHSLAAEAEDMAALRASANRDALDRLSRPGDFSNQFEGGSISLPEILVSTWCFTRGDRKSAAKVLFPRLETVPDQRVLFLIARDVLGNGYHEAMLDAFSESRDYARTIAFAEHLSRPVFNGYVYQDRARELAEQLRSRSEDFKTFVLPRPEEWQKMRDGMTREEQITFLARRLRLLNCQQRRQPGDVSYAEPQLGISESEVARLYAPRRHFAPVLSPQQHKALLAKEQVINPFTELWNMQLTVSELPTLVPYLTDESFMPTYSFWRDFDPGRTLHRVNWAVAELVDEAAHRDLVDAFFLVYRGLDVEGKQKLLEKTLAWCHDHAGDSATDLILSTLRSTKSWREFEPAAAGAVRFHVQEALPVLLSRAADFDGGYSRGKIAQFAWELDVPAAAQPARKWLRDDDRDVSFFAALILLKHGDREHLEGLAELGEILAEDEGGWLYPLAVETLLGTHREECLALADGILDNKGFRLLWGYANEDVVLRLFLAGRRKCLDALLKDLSDARPSGSVTYVEREGTREEQPLSIADETAEVVSTWRVDGYTYDESGAEEGRRQQRAELASWLTEQFQRVTSGEKPEVRPPGPLLPEEFTVNHPKWAD